MSEEELFFIKTGQIIKDAEHGQMFGKPCFKINGKAFICFFQNCMVFKLSDPFHKETLNLDGAKLFDPSGKNRPMREWVQLPFIHKDKWKNFAFAASEYVKG